MFFGITKGAGHSATAGIDIDYFRGKGSRERSALAGHGFLMDWPLQQDFLWS